MLLPATIPVIVAYELYPLDADMKPGDLAMSIKQYYPHFPYLNTVLGKQDALKKWLSGRHAHTEALYFKCKVLNQDSKALIFSYEDFFQSDPGKRCAIAWQWDTIHGQGVGIALYNEQQN